MLATTPCSCTTSSTRPSTRPSEMCNRTGPLTKGCQASGVLGSTLPGGQVPDEGRLGMVACSAARF